MCGVVGEGEVRLGGMRWGEVGWGWELISSLFVFHLFTFSFFVIWKGLFLFHIVKISLCLV